MLIDYTKEIIDRLRRDSYDIGELGMYACEIDGWIYSKERLSQLTGCHYYRGRQDILRKKRTAIGEGGKTMVIDNLPNSRVIDNQYAKMVNQKVNYMLGKPLTFKGEDKGYIEQLTQVFDKGFMRLMKNTLKYTLNCGIAWLYPYYNNGKLDFRMFPGYEVLPFWADNEHTQLDCALRLYFILDYDGRNLKVHKKVELYKTEGVYLYEFQGSKLVEDYKPGETSNFHPYVEGARPWEKIPLIAFKNGSDEIPLINRVKSLQDGLNLLLSNFEDCMQENVRNTILVIKNYDGEDLGQFRRNLATYGAVKVKTVDGSQGGVEALSIEVNADNYKTILELFKKAIIENAMGYDAKDDRLSGNPNQMNIQSMYSDIDLDANEIETEYQAALEELLEFVNIYLDRSGDVDIIFNRDMLMNESEIIDNCLKSFGLLSEETVISQHPWSSNAQDELKRKKREEADGYDKTLGGDAEDEE